ncbi:MAG TPA: hypothetical protein VFL97_10305 [Nitrococcus sp.]|nr:hypothetical protein [Nitrococcus sp.]
MVLDSTQYATLWDFYNNTVNGGADGFTWTHPVTGDAASVRFTAVSTVAVAGGDYYQVNMQFEVLP